MIAGDEVRTPGMLMMLDTNICQMLIGCMMKIIKTSHLPAGADNNIELYIRTVSIDEWDKD